MTSGHVAANSKENAIQDITMKLEVLFNIMMIIGWSIGIGR